MEVDPPVVIKTREDSQSSTSTTSSRKRRHSMLEEAVITIIETSGNDCNSAFEKRIKLDDSDEDKKTNENEPSSSKAEDKPPSDIPVEETTDASQSNINITPPKAQDNEASNAEKDKQRVTPIRIALVTKEKRKTRNSSSSKDTTAKIITPIKDKEKEKTPLRPKSTRFEKGEKTPLTKTDKVEKSLPKTEKTAVSKAIENIETPSSSKSEKIEKKSLTPNIKVSKEVRSKVQKRRNSRNSRSTNSTSSTRSLERTEKTYESAKEKRRASNSSAKEKDKDSDPDKSGMEKQMSPKSTPELLTPKPVQDRLQFDDDTTLAVLARETSKSTVSSNNTGLPTITCVRSLSTTAQHSGVTITRTTTNATIDITEEATSDSSIFTPTSSESVVTLQDAVSKLQRLRNEPEPLVGRVGVRAFARMTSPEKQSANDEVQVEIKAEPIDLDEADRHMEKMDLMNAFRLRPVNPQPVPNPPMNLRDVRINKVVVTPLNARKTMPPLVAGPKAPEIRPRAKKTFPQPKKPEDGRSEQLNSKNSMVYIPIQPPMTQAPVRLPRPQQSHATVTSVLRPAVSSVGKFYVISHLN